jgi:hypothetical protein
MDKTVKFKVEFESNNQSFWGGLRSPCGSLMQ